MAYPRREHDPERIKEDMLIGTKKRINGVDKYWSGPDLGYQTKATFEKLKEEGYKGNQDYMLLGGWQGHRARLGRDKVLEAASPHLQNIQEKIAPTLPYLQKAYETAVPWHTRKSLEIGGSALLQGLDLVEQGTTAASRALGVDPFWGNAAIETAAELATPYVSTTALKAANKGLKIADKLPGFPISRIQEAARDLTGGAAIPMNTPGSVGAAGRGLSDGQLRLLEQLTPEAIAEISDPGLRMMYGKAAKMLNTPGLSKRNAEALLQTGPDSGLIELLKGVDNPVVMDKAITSYFTRNPIYFSGGYGFNLDHLVPISSTAKLASKVKPAVFQEALALQLKKFGRKFGHDQEFSLMPRRTHAAKHTGTPEIGDLSPDWKTKYLDGIIDDLPENASVEQVNEALSKMYDTSLYHTGQALQSKDFFSIREGVMESLPSNIRTILGENFDITGRMSSVEDPLKWKLFLGHLRQAPGDVKAAIKEISQVKQLELINLKDYQ